MSYDFYQAHSLEIRYLYTPVVQQEMSNLPMINQSSPASVHLLPVEENSLRALIKRIASGSQPDVATLFDETSTVIFALVVRMVGQGVAAEAILLDIFVQVWRQAAQYNPADQRPFTWLSRLARQQALAALRVNESSHSQRARPVIGETASPVGATAQPPRLSKALDALPAEERRALEMAYFGGLDCHQIAAELRLAPDLIQRRIGIALTDLRQQLSK